MTRAPGLYGLTTQLQMDLSSPDFFLLLSWNFLVESMLGFALIFPVAVVFGLLSVFESLGSKEPF